MAQASRITRVHNPRRTKQTHRRANVTRKAAAKHRRPSVTTSRQRKALPKNVGRGRSRNGRAKRNPFLLEWATIPNPYYRPKSKSKSKSKSKGKRRVNPMAKAKHRKSMKRVRAGKKAARTRARRRSNPKATYRRTRKRRSTAVVHRRRRRNPRAVVHKTYRRKSRRSSNRRHYGRRRNPALFGHTGAKDMLMIVGGGLVGVAATKFLPTLIPASLTSTLGNSSFVSIAITGAGAFAAGWLATRFVGKTFGEAVLFGGLMQTGSAILNAFAPASIRGALALSGVGDIVRTAGYAVPQNPVLQMPPPMTGVSGFRGGSFARR